MDIENMHYRFDILTRQIAAVEDRPFTSTEAEYFLNKAQEEIFEEFYSKREGRPDKKFEATEKLRRELNELIEFVDITVFDAATEVHTNGSFVNIPDDFLYSIEEECSVTYTDCNDDTQTKIMKVVPITFDEYLANVNNPFGKPHHNEDGLIWRMDFNKGAAASTSKRHELITDGAVTLTHYYLRYLKRLTAMVIESGTDCVLDESLHEEIVNRAVRLALMTLPIEKREPSKEGELIK